MKLKKSNINIKVSAQERLLIWLGPVKFTPRNMGGGDNPSTLSLVPNYKTFNVKRLTSEAFCGPLRI